MQLTYLLSLPLLATLAVAADASAGAKKMSFTAFGVGVSNYTRSYNFYTKVLGLTDTGLTIPTDDYDETILTAPSGSGFLLMSWKTPRPTSHLPIKLVFGSPDVPAQIEKIRKAGYKIIKEPDPVLNLAFAEDPDGNLLEFNPA